MGYAFNVDVKEITDKAILDGADDAGQEGRRVKGKVTGTGTAGIAVAHFGSNNMIAFRYKLKNVPMKIAEKSFTADGVEFPAGSFVITGTAPTCAAARAAVEQFGLTAAALSALPTVAMHDARRAARRDLLAVERHAGARLVPPRVRPVRHSVRPDLQGAGEEGQPEGRLRRHPDGGAEHQSRARCSQPPAARPQPYQKSDKYKFLGMYGETPDMQRRLRPGGRRRVREVPRRAAAR